MWFSFSDNKDFIKFKERYPNYDLPKFKIGDVVKIKKDFYEINKKYVNYNYNDSWEISFFSQNIENKFTIRTIEYNLDEKLIYYNFIESDYYLGEPCITDTILDSYLKKRINVYEHLKTFNQFNNKL